MPTGNPLEQLRRRMQSHATPTAFAALAEEHRRAGRFDEAIAVCRDGLARYPTYVSARVTLGRALLDSGDVAGATAELEQAVLQAPDNFAAVRALDAARAAAGPAAAVAAPPPDLTLHAPSQDDTADIPIDLVARALGTGVDGPQEFGLGPDWSLPEPPRLAPDEAPPADPAVEIDTAVTPLHADAPTMAFTPPHLQGEEPAGIWRVPATTGAAEPVTDAAPVFSWALDPPSGNGDPHASSHDGALVTPPPSIWDAPTIDAPLVGIEAVPATPIAAAAVGAASFDTPAEAPAGEAFSRFDLDPATGSDAPEAPSSFWSGLDDVHASADGGDPVPFAGWGDVPAPAVDTTGTASAWGDQDATGSWASQDGPSAAWALPGPDEVSLTPFQDVLDQDVQRPVPASFAERETTGVDPVPFGPDVTRPVDAAPWHGSLASALEEVFAGAAGPVASLEPPTSEITAVRIAMADAAVEAALTEAAGGSLEPPTSEVTAVRMAMADLAVEAAIEDASQDDAVPALASLEQLLAAVRARRASLFSTVP